MALTRADERPDELPPMTYWTANQFDEFWSEDPLGRVAALAAIAKGLANDRTAPRYICIRSGVTGLQLAKTIDAYLRENPQALDMEIGALAAAALIKYFPCQSP
jgi:hypothetical protein